jgi:hypothetical protein
MVYYNVSGGVGKEKNNLVTGSLFGPSNMYSS